ncbi:helix-turn-helix domain-containing protein [Anaerocolumna chitinilytica]|uniref:HTH cro/C1-type domain-containing protein n=1 Tax=Anaerocolumna chitinilytica TaxID=1727145 RepID=A0A7I8DSF9_9FIRM|nr:helix-turn-helix transcriptional regulator [Anaerocolumna chitinilytica]BCK00046.1 hypothetical protein bsdcttw_30860 [Anaerocolumna chitinilytica]
MIFNENETFKNKIGFAIQYFRQKNKLSQSALCKGVCSVSALSRIEAGEREADALLLEVLLERMGKTTDKFELILTDSDYVSFQKRQEIKRLIHNNDLVGAAEQLDLYQLINQAKGNVHKQFITRTESKINELKGGAIEKSIDLLTKAVTYTVPDFRTNGFNEYLLSSSELDIIIDIAIKYSFIGASAKAKDILFQILEYLDMRKYMEAMNNLYPKVSIILCRLLNQTIDFDKIIEICSKGLKKDKSNLKLEYKGELLLIKAQTREFMIKRENMQLKMVKEYLKYYLEAYYIFDICGNTTKTDYIKRYLKEENAWEYID